MKSRLSPRDKETPKMSVRKPEQRMGKMGKAKRMRGSARMDPIAASGKVGGMRGGGGTMMEEAATEEMTGHIVSELGDMSAERRAKAAHAVAGVAATGMVGLQALLKLGVVGKLTRLLCDVSVEVRAAAAAALRNAGIRGGDAAYAAIVEADVMTPLLSSIQQVGTELSAGGGRMEAAKELACILLDLLWELCESSAAAVDRFNAAGPAFPTSLTQLVCPPIGLAAPEVASSAAQCLHVLSEDNPQAETFFRATPAALAALHSVISDAATPPLVAALCCGTAMNLGTEFRPADLPASLHRIFAAAMAQDHVSALPAALAQVSAAANGELEVIHEAALEEGHTGGAGGEGAGRQGGTGGKQQRNIKAIKQQHFKEQFLHTEVDAAESVRSEMDRWSKGVTLSQVALQILANMLLSAAEELEGSDGSDGWESCENEDMQEEAEGGAQGSEGDGDVAAWAVQSGLLQAACLLCQWPPAAVLEAVAAVGEPALPAFESLCGMQINALDCVSNWVSCAPDHAATEMSAVSHGVLGALCTSSPLVLAQMPVECLPHLREVDEALSGLASAYARRSVDGRASVMHASVHEALARWVQPGCGRQTRSNAVFCLGALGKAERGAAANGAIGALLLGVVQTSNDVVAASEALGSIYDCYAEDDVNDTVLAPMGMLPALVALQGAFLAASKQWLLEAKGTAKCDVDVKRKAAMVREARANLPRFIAYKKEMGLAC